MKIISKRFIHPYTGKINILEISLLHNKLSQFMPVYPPSTPSAG